MFLVNYFFRNMSLLSIGAAVLMTNTWASLSGLDELDNALQLKNNDWIEKCEEYKHLMSEREYLYLRYEQFEETTLDEGFNSYLRLENVTVPLLENGVVRTYRDNKVLEQVIGDRIKSQNFKLSISEEPIETFGDHRQKSEADYFLNSNDLLAVEIFPNELSVFLLYTEDYKRSPDDLHCKEESEIADKRVLYLLNLKTNRGEGLYFIESVKGVAKFLKLDDYSILDIHFESQGKKFNVSYSLFGDQTQHVANAIMTHIKTVD